MLYRIAKSITRSCMMLLVAAALITPAADAATMIDGRPNNPYGVMLGMWGGDSSDYASIHFGWAREVSGEWGHVRVSSGVHDFDIEGAVRTLAICRAKRLIPVMTGLYVPEEYRIPGGEDAAPYVRDDGYPKAAERYGEWAEELTRLGAVVPYCEIGNEINGKWKPEAYGEFIIGVSKALKQAMPKTKVVSAGLAGNGADFLTEVLQAVPRAKDYIDCWGLHPYGANHPPAYDKDGYCLKGHLWTAEALAQFGVTDPRFVMTESGYEICNKRDNRYPRITDELRAKYLVEAYETIWAPDPRVVTLTLFMLQSANYPGWDGWILIDTYCRKTETFKALAEVPKPKGSDWMPQGKCSIAGRITDADSGQGLERVFVYTVPGIYAAETDADGRYTITDLPAGSYEVRMFRDGFISPPGQKVRASGSKAARCDSTMKRVGLVTIGMDGGERVASGWLAVEGAPSEHYAVDRQVKRSGNSSQKLSARPGSPPGIWHCTGYASAVPDKVFAAEVWVKGKGVKLGGGQGAALRLSVTDSGAQPLSTAIVNLPLEGDFDWTPLSVSIAPYPPGRRLTLECKFDAQEGQVWFDDPYCHYADYPVPSRMAMQPGTGSVKGEVTAEKGEYMAETVVCLRPGNFWTLTRSDGTYEITGVPAGTYDVWAFRRGKSGGARYGVRVGAGRSVEVLLEMANPPAPRSVQNGDFEHRGPSQDYTPGWTKFGEFDGIPTSGWHKGIPDHPEGMQARTGNAFAGSIAGSNVKNGGLYQTIEVDPDKCYRVSVWSYTYQTDEGHRGDVANRLGVDPTGGDDPSGPYVIWTPFRPSHLRWTELALEVAPVEDRMTIFIEAKQVHGLMFNVNCFDDISVVECAKPLPDHEMVDRVIKASAPAQPGAGPPEKTRSEVYQPRFLWTLTAPGNDPSDVAGEPDDIGPPIELREKWMRQSGMTFWGVSTKWSDAEPKRLPEGAKEQGFDWTAFNNELDSIPPRMAVQCHIRLDAPWAEALLKENEAEYWRLAERFIEHAARLAHSRGVLYYRVPGNEMSLTMRPDWAELYMKPVRHYANAIHRGHPDNQVIAGALVVGDRAHIGALYEAGFKEHCDVLDIHAYASSPGEMRYNVGLSQVIESHKVMEEYGDGHKRIFLGEGWSVFPLPPHIDHLKQPPAYTQEDFDHYRRAVVYGYAALTTPRPDYDPNWLLGASFFCLNDLWGSMGWKKRAKIEYDEDGDPAFWLLDGYKFPYEPTAMDPQFRTWGLIDIHGNPKGDIIKHFPPYIPRSSIKAEFVNNPSGKVFPGRPYRVRVGFTNNEPSPFENLRFGMDVFKGPHRDGVEFADLNTAVPESLARSRTAEREFDMIVKPEQAGREIWVQGGCEYDWLGGSYYTDGWLKFQVESPGSLALKPHKGLAAGTDGSVEMTFVLTDRTGAPLPERLEIGVDQQVSVTQTSRGAGAEAREYTVIARKKDANAGGAFELTAKAGGTFSPVTAGIAFPRPGRTPETYPAKGRLINGGFEEFGPGSGFEGWDGPPSNWEDPDMMADLPNHGSRYLMKAYCGTKYAAENSQVVLAPAGFKVGDKVTASVWCNGLAQVDATDHDAVRFRVSVQFRGADGKELRRDDSPLLKGAGRWEKLAFTTGGTPEGTHSIRLILMHENTNDHSWHKAAMDNVELRFGAK